MRMLYNILDRLPFRIDLRIPECKKISKIFTRRQWTNLSASSMSQGKLVAAKTITIFRLPSSPVELLFTPSTWTRSSDLTLRDDSCSPEALKNWSHTKPDSILMMEKKWVQQSVHTQQSKQLQESEFMSRKRSVCVGARERERVRVGERERERERL
jgi:hypothetical protein